MSALARSLRVALCLSFGALPLGCTEPSTTWIGGHEQSAAGSAGAPSNEPDCEPVGPGDACTALPTRLLPRLTVSGPDLLQNGRPYHLYAISRSELLWGEDNREGCNGDDHFHDRDLEAIAAWSFNTVRIGLSQARWFGRACEAASYPIRIDHAVQMANAHGLYALLELHWTDLAGQAPCGADCQTGLVPMPERESPQLWREVAARYRDNPGVLFDLFNEPAPSGEGDAAWTCWRDGGCSITIDDPVDLTYTATGMQALFDAARSSAPETVIVVAGADHATDLSGVERGFALNGEQVLYSAHMYNGRGYGPADWLARFGALAASHPVLISELGPLDCSADETTHLLDYLDQPLDDPARRIGWGVRSWNLPGDCGYPSIIADFSGTPLGDHGQVVQARLRAYGSDAGPVPP